MDGMIEVNSKNLEKEHICCAISDKAATQAKKEWMQECFGDGYRFYKAEDRGKAFVECVPAENAWAPICADGYLFIDCFWVSGALAGQGTGTRLLEWCRQEAKRLGRKGLVALSSDKKRPFLSEPGFYRKKGFQCADTAKPYFELVYLPFDVQADAPRFCACAKEGKGGDVGITIYYTDHCPWNAKYIPLLKQVATQRSADVDFIRFTTKEEAQQSPSPFTTYALYYNEEFVTNEMFSAKKFEKFLDEKGL